MPGNEFEKQVQQKMDELKFVPSATVWQQVEKQINERKKRRLPFLWLLLLGVLLGGATWLYKTNGIEEKPSAAPAEHAVTGPAQTAIDKTKAATPDNAAFQRKQHGATMPAEVAVEEKQVIEPGNAAATVKPGKAAITAQGRATPAALPASAGTSTSVHNKETLSATTKAGKKRHSVKSESAGETAIVKAKSPIARHKLFIEQLSATGQQPAPPASVTDNKEDKTDNTVKDNNTAAQAMLPAAAAGVTDTIAALSATAVVPDSIQQHDTADSPQLIAQKKPSGKKKKNMQWGISAGIGGSNISQGISGVVSDVFSASTAYSVAADRNNTQNSPGNATGGNLNSFTRPGALKPGLSYSLNLFVSKPLGRHFQLMAGLGYSYYSMGLEVGSKIDSNKALLQFSNGNSTAYTNRFHFIELPVTIQKQLGKSSRFSVNGGLALSLLAASNALQYSASKNIYFKDNSNINKVQLGLMAGANYRFLQKSFVMEAGPQLRYGLSNILNKETYGSLHLFFAGINARVYFNRNKR